MKATFILLMLMAMATAAVVAAQPVNPAVALHAANHAMEPVWMLVSGAGLLALASAVRRYIP